MVSQVAGSSTGCYRGWGRETIAKRVPAASGRWKASCSAAAGKLNRSAASDATWKRDQGGKA